MITYAYWALVIILVVIIVALVGLKFKKWPAAGILGALVFVIGWSAYNFHFEQIFVKKYGGVMNVTVPQGQHHITATWKDEHLWIENYDPETNSCIFTEFSKGNMLQGRVTIKNCNPLRAGQ